MNTTSFINFILKMGKKAEGISIEYVGNDCAILCKKIENEDYYAYLSKKHNKIDFIYVHYAKDEGICYFKKPCGKYDVFAGETFFTADLKDNNKNFSVFENELGIIITNDKTGKILITAINQQFDNLYGNIVILKDVKTGKYSSFDCKKVAFTHEDKYYMKINIT